MIGLPRTTQSSRFGFEEEEEAVEVPAASVHMIDGRSFSPITSGVSLFVNNRIGYAIAEALSAGLELAMKISVGSTLVYDVFANSENTSHMFKLVNKPSDIEVAAVIRFLVENFTFKNVIVLDSLVAASFIPDRYEAEPSIRILQTGISLYQSEFSFPGIPLEVGNMVTGLTAALVSSLDARNVCATALLSISETAFEITQAQKFEEHWETISAAFSIFGLNIRGELPRPSSDIYIKLRKSDPFLSRTESLYI